MQLLHDWGSLFFFSPEQNDSRNNKNEKIQKVLWHIHICINMAKYSLLLNDFDLWWNIWRSKSGMFWRTPVQWRLQPVLQHCWDPDFSRWLCCQRGVQAGWSEPERGAVEANFLLMTPFRKYAHWRIPHTNSVRAVVVQQTHTHSSNVPQKWQS